MPSFLPVLFIRSQGLRKLYSQMLAPLLENFHLTQLELDIILFLANNPGYDTARDIVELRHLSKSHVSVGVDSLAGRGLLERSYQAGNRKTIHLRLLPAADEIVAAGREVQQQYGETLFRGFSQAQREELVQLLDRISRNVDSALANQEERTEE